MFKNFDITNFEKILLGILFSVVVIIASIKYFVVGDITNNWVQVITITGGFFTVRKVISYFKKTI